MFEQQRNLYEQRVKKFIHRLQTLFYERSLPLQVSCRLFEGFESFEERESGPFQPIERGKPWGENWQRAWFHLTGRVPEGWQGAEVVAHINLGGEGLWFSADGLPLYALSIHTIWPIMQFRRDRIDLIPAAQGGEAVDLWIEASAGQLLGVRLEDDNGNLAPKTFGRYAAALEYADLAVFRRDIWQLFLDARTLFDQLTALGEQSVRRARLLHDLNQAIDVFSGDPATTARAREILGRQLRVTGSTSDLRTQAVGHAHIDTAWLWPVDETIRKCARTFAAQLWLMDRYPQYVFGASQAQHYQFIKQYYPNLYDKIRQKVKEGRWEVQGGMWVEADSNLISGESMVRQILHGKNFFRDEFDVEVRNLWLPDVFGYSAAMPQIMLKSGLSSFVTQKLSWNQFNRFPHNTFMWQGIDGSAVLTHFPPEDNYNSDLRPSALMKAAENFSEKEQLDEFLTLFGVGDGGSGATPEMIETGMRQKNLERTPRVVFGRAQHFLDRLSAHQDRLPRWEGELYFELHRGTLTSQAHNKMMNRRMELQLRATEILFSLLPLQDYPSEQLDGMWKKLLINQFHDIIPGSAITPVYERSRKDYAELAGDTQELINQAAAQLFHAAEDHLSFFNSLSVVYRGLVALPQSWQDCQVSDLHGDPVPVQHDADGSVALVDIAPFSTISLKKGPSGKRSGRINNSAQLLENERIRYTFDEQGTIVHIFDKEVGREIIPKDGAGNRLSLYEDRPVDWDAWDIDIFYENQLLEQARLTAGKRIADGPLRSALQFRFEVGQSKMEQTVVLRRGSKRLDFENTVDWQESHKMLRVSFDTNIRSGQASFEIQFGHVKRPTHRNTSWDMARFEVCGHRYADLSDHDYGVALLNNCKYGHKILGGTLDLNLLRAPTMPDPAADRGWHNFTYSLLPHTGDLVRSDVLMEAARLNQPPLRFEDMSAANLEPPFVFESGQIVLDTVKKAEKEMALILRFYEAHGRAGQAELIFNRKIKLLTETDLMEGNDQPVDHDGGRVDLHFRAFEIKTLKVKYE